MLPYVAVIFTSSGVPGITFMTIRLFNLLDIVSTKNDVPNGPKKRLRDPNRLIQIAYRRIAHFWGSLWFLLGSRGCCATRLADPRCHQNSPHGRLPGMEMVPSGHGMPRRKCSQEGIDVFLEGDSHNGHVVCLRIRSTLEFCKHLDILRGAVPVNQFS